MVVYWLPMNSDVLSLIRNMPLGQEVFLIKEVRD